MYIGTTYPLVVVVGVIVFCDLIMGTAVIVVILRVLLLIIYVVILRYYVPL